MSDTWILYQTTNLLNGKIYVGVHKVADTAISRKYLGSGKALKIAIEKHGKENFTRVTLAEFSCAEKAYLAETNTVTQEFINRQDTYNMKIGGMGGTGWGKGKHLTEETKAKIAAAKIGKKASAETRAKLSAAAKGKVFTVETRNKISTANRNRSAETRAKIGAKVSATLKISSPNIGKKFSEETKERMRVASKTNKPVIVYGKFYTSLNQASKFEKTTLATVQDRIKSCKPKWDGWRLATEEEIARFLKGGASEE